MELNTFASLCSFYFFQWGLQKKTAWWVVPHKEFTSMNGSDNLLTADIPAKVVIPKLCILTPRLLGVLPGRLCCSAPNSNWRLGVAEIAPAYGICTLRKALLPVLAPLML